MRFLPATTVIFCIDCPQLIRRRKEGNFVFSFVYSFVGFSLDLEKLLLKKVASSFSRDFLKNLKKQKNMDLSLNLKIEYVLNIMAFQFHFLHIQNKKKKKSSLGIWREKLLEITVWMKCYPQNHHLYFKLSFWYLIIIIEYDISVFLLSLLWICFHESTCFFQELCLLSTSQINSNPCGSWHGFVLLNWDVWKTLPLSLFLVASCNFSANKLKWHFDSNA